jgi:hypothetical protein
METYSDSVGISPDLCDCIGRVEKLVLAPPPGVLVRSIRSVKALPPPALFLSCQQLIKNKWQKDLLGTLCSQGTKLSGSFEVDSWLAAGSL